mmetsp:Transcript_4818/g.17026  ORF Transcript_4818/g.17026 Transcript_4818/m.17026 type:complete len:341 (-) Transcript_4818:399-1421(-)
MPFFSSLLCLAERRGLLRWIFSFASLSTYSSRCSTWYFSWMPAYLGWNSSSELSSSSSSSPPLPSVSVAVSGSVSVSASASASVSVSVSVSVSAIVTSPSASVLSPPDSASVSVSVSSFRDSKRALSLRELFLSAGLEPRAREGVVLRGATKTWPLFESAARLLPRTFSKFAIRSLTNSRSSAENSGQCSTSTSERALSRSVQSCPPALVATAESVFITSLVDAEGTCCATAACTAFQLAVFVLARRWTTCVRRSSFSESPAVPPILLSPENSAASAGGTLLRPLVLVTFSILPLLLPEPPVIADSRRFVPDTRPFRSFLLGTASTTSTVFAAPCLASSA